jgi:hypothetical protein
MMTPDDARCDLATALRDHLKTIIDNSMSLVVDDKSLGEAVGKYAVGLRFIRIFHDLAAKVIDKEFSSGD